MTTPDMPSTATDQEVLQMGISVWEKMRGETPGVFNKDFWQGRILEWAMKDPSFKIDMFRFVDVLPTLQSKDQVAQHIKEYLLRDNRELPGVLKAALKAASGGLTAGIASAAIRKNVTDMAERFIVGTDAASALPVLKKLHHQKGGGIAFTVDLLGEATVSEVEADTYRDRYLDLIEGLATEVATWKEDPVIDRNHLGPIPRTNVSVKISAMDSQIDPADPAGSVARLKKRVLPLFLKAKAHNVFLNVDLETWAVHGITYDLFEDILSHPELKDWPHFGIVIQAYLKSAPRDFDRVLHLAKTRGAPITVRLVKGAYWDYETVHALQNGWEPPVFQEKAQTDVMYEDISKKLLANIDHTLPAFGSHNLRSVTHALVLAKEMKVPERAYEVQMLTGMAEPERKTFRALGHRVRVYAPVGEMLPGMAYLVRRLLENTSNDGFLKLSHHDGVDQKALLAAPAPKGAKDRHRRKLVRQDLDSPFDNCRLRDFTDDNEREAFALAVESLPKEFPIQVPVVVTATDTRDRPTFARECPSDISMKVADVSAATVDDANAAVAAAAQAFPAWRNRPLRERAQLLETLADKLEEDRDKLSALMVYEVGKPWKGADADVAEAVDFCRYYARQALLELGERKQGDVDGEDNRYLYEGRGVCAVIAPWNFPLAILCGMCGAALVAGNTIVAKPAEQSSAIGYALYERMLAAGFPPEVVQFLPGVGEDIGPTLVAHPDVMTIAFTGSRSVGLSIWDACGKVVPGQRGLKRAICEMGGKNAIIVDDDADLDEAVFGVVDSAFTFSGQKCSAASRVIVIESIYDAFMERLAEASHSAIVAPAFRPGVNVGPVVDKDAYERLNSVIANPGEGVTVRYSGAVPSEPVGHYICPTVFEVKDPQHRVMQEEFFGPIVAAITAPTFERAVELANESEYALTGAVYSRSPAHLDYARTHFRVGNLYLNRGSTGALVDRQPFGGFAMSGGGTKAGGPGYLLQFANPRVVTENTMRRGFTPELA